MIPSMIAPYFRSILVVLCLVLGGCSSSPSPYWMYSDAEVHPHVASATGTIPFAAGAKIPQLPIRILYPAQLTPAAVSALYEAYRRYPLTHEWEEVSLVRSQYSTALHEVFVRDLLMKSAYFASEYCRWLKSEFKDRTIFLEPYTLDVNADGIPFPSNPNISKSPTALDVYFDCLPSILRLEQITTFKSSWYSNNMFVDFGMEAPARVMVVKGGSSPQNCGMDGFVQVCLYPYDAKPYFGWNLFTDFTRKSVPENSYATLWTWNVSSLAPVYTLETSETGKISIIRKCLSARYKSAADKNNEWFDVSYVEKPQGSNIPFARLWSNYANHLADDLDRADVRSNEVESYLRFIGDYDPALVKILKEAYAPLQAGDAAKLQFIQAIYKFENEYAAKVSNKITAQIYLSDAGIAFRGMIQNEELLRRQIIIQANARESAQLMSMLGAMSQINGAMLQMRGGANPMLLNMNQAIQGMARQGQMMNEAIRRQTVLTDEQGETFRMTSDNLISVYLNVASGAIEVTGKNLDELRAKFMELYRKRFFSQ